jgi:hypothetical protein
VSNIAVRALLLAMVLTALPAATGQYEVLAVPVTVSDRVEVPLPDEAREARGPAGGVGAQGLEVAADAVARTPAVEAPMPFSMVGFELPDGVDELRVRTSVDGERWTEWVETERVEAEDGPDPDTAEAAGDRSHRFAEPVWVEEASYLQVELPDGVEAEGRLHAEVIDSVGLSGQKVERTIVPAEPASADAVDRPRIISRAGWGANESWRSGSPSRASSVSMGVVHHTATSNSYSDAKAVMRSMYSYHTRSLGWSDLGYNIVVDQQGNVYEGRAGGLESGVIGAHARGYNTGSFGVSVIGNFDQVRPPRAALDAVAEVIAWQSSVYGINPEGWANGRRTIVGHRDVGNTACPGAYFYPRLPEVRADAAARMSSPPADPGPITYTPPKTTITSAPEGTSTSRDARITWSATGDVSYFECQENGGAWYACASPRNLTELPDGKHTFRVRGVMPSDPPLPPEDRVRETQPAEVSWEVRWKLVLSDIEGRVHEQAIRAIAEAGITGGYRDGTFRPAADVTRGQMATFLSRALDLEGAAGDRMGFSDTDGHPHAEGISAVAVAGITEGYDDGTFRPNVSVSREQLATFLARALELESDGEVSFSDTVDSAHLAGIAAVAAAGITEGYPDGTFRPADVVSREQMASFLQRGFGL